MGRTALLACPEGGTSLSAMAGLDRSSFNTEPGLRSISFSILCFCAVCCCRQLFCCTVKRSTSSPSPSAHCVCIHTPPFVAARHLPPARGKSFLKGRGLGMTAKFLFKVQSAWFRQRLSLWESWHRAAMTERASPLTKTHSRDVLLHTKRTVARYFVQRFFLDKSHSVPACA